MSQGRFEPSKFLTYTQIWRAEIQQTNSSLFSALEVAILLSRNPFHILSEDQGLVGSTKSCQS